MVNPMDTSLNALRADYASLWATAHIRPEHASAPRSEAARIIVGRPKYEAVGLIPWELIGLMHLMEADLSFQKHLHNGDLLYRMNATGGRDWLPTVQVPAGRGPFGSWNESAVDAISYEIEARNIPASTLAALQSRQIEAALWWMEGFNGFGTRRRGINSPYLCGMTTAYTKGKYVRDGVFDPDAVSKQCGVIPVLREIARAGGEAWVVGGVAGADQA